MSERKDRTKIAVCKPDVAKIQHRDRKVNLRKIGNSADFVIRFYLDSHYFDK